MANNFKFKTSAVSEAVSKKLVIERLPEWMQSLEQIQMFFDDSIQPWFNPAEQELVNGYIGDRGSPAAAGKIFLAERDVQRQEYQFSPAYVSRNTDKSIRSLQFYEDLVGFLGNNGSLNDNETRLLNGKYYSWVPAINPNKILNFSSYYWDNENEFAIKPDYIVMERGALNGNTWSLQNFWYSVGETLPDGTVLDDTLAQSTRFTPGAVPIIEYNKNIELVNYGTRYRGQVDYYADSVKPEDIAQRRITDEVKIDGSLLKAGDRVLFTSIGNKGENNRIYKIYVKTMEDNTKVYGLALDEDEINTTRPTGEPLVGDVILVTSGTTYGNKTFYWNGISWTLSQVKSGINTAPSFVLYDKNGVKLNDSTVYPSSDFTGSQLFGLKINYDYSQDKTYGLNVELSSNNYYVFENYLSTQVFTYMVDTVQTEIDGLYFYNVITEDTNNIIVQNLKSEWVRYNEDSKQFVRQVYGAVKTAMFRTFDTLYEMNNYSSVVENMYGYVLENDQTYQYYKKTGSSTSTWNVTTSDGVMSDIYNTTYEVAQKINPSTDQLEVTVDGEILFPSAYTTVLNDAGFVDFVTINDASSFTDDTIVDIRTYSATITPNKELGAYEIPINLKNNPYNDIVDYTNASLYTTHFQEVIRKNITTGYVNDSNDYELQLLAGNVDTSVGTQIIQNETGLLPLMLTSANENLNLFKAIMNSQSEYFRFKNKFNTKMLQLYNANPSTFSSKTATTLVDEILTAINIGKDSSFAFYNSGMGATTSVPKTFIPVTPQFAGVLQTYTPLKATYIHAGKALGLYNVDHTGVISQTYSSINNAPILDNVIFELETRIYNSIDSTFTSPDYVPVLNSSKLKPTPYHQNSEYTSDEFDLISSRGYANFIATNDIDSTKHDYIQSNWMTWNFTGSTYVVDGNPTTIPARGSWRAIYQDMYGTYRPHTNPWEMLGFSMRPTWWNEQYKPTVVQIGAADTDIMTVYEAYVTNENGDLVPSGLWDTTAGSGDVSTGTILFGTNAGVHPEYKRFGTVPFTITATGETSTNGNPISTVDLISPVDLGMISGSLTHLAEPWKFGDLGEIEFAYKNSPLYSYDKALTLLRAKPAQFANYFYDTKNDKLQTVKNGSPQFLYKNTKERLNFNSTTLVSNENGVAIIGYQTWISDYLTYQNMNITTNYGDILRSSYINVGHRLGAYSKQDQLTFTSDSFGVVSQDNQRIGLVKSSVFQESILSSLKITWTGNGFSLNGYDLVNSTLPYQNPNKIGKRSTVSVGNSKVVYYSEYLDTTSSYDYGTLLKTPQEIFTFICAYGEYMERQGWIFEDIDSNGEYYNWTNIAKSFLDWAGTSKDTGDFLVLSPSSASAKFGSEFGTVLSVTQYSGGVWSLLDTDGNGIRVDEIGTSRIGNVFNVRMDDDSTKRMSLIHLNLVSFEHAIVFDDTTIFGNNIYIPTYGVTHEMLKMYGYITGSWNGRLEAPGFMILENGTLPNFEKLVNDFTKYYDNDNPTDNATLSSLGRHLIGFQTRDYLTKMITNESSQVDFYKGFIRDKGTQQAFDKVLRVSKTYNTENYKALQEWAFKIGTYGNISGKKHLQFKMYNNTIKQNPQMFIFNKTDQTDDSTYVISSADFTFDVTDGTADAGDMISVLPDSGYPLFKTSNNMSNQRYITYTSGDADWVTQPKGTVAFPMRSGKSENIKFPNIGPVTLDEVNIVSKDFDSIYTERTNYFYKYKAQPITAWVLRDTTQNWNLFNVVNTGIHIVSIEIADFDSSDTYCTITLDAPHGLSTDDYYFFIDSTGLMPDPLSVERQYYFTGSSSNQIITSLDVANAITFGTDMPVLYRYVSQFSTEAEKDAYVAKKYSYDAPETMLFDRPTTYNSLTNETDTTFNIYDPINGVIPGSLLAEIKYTTPVNPAKFNAYEVSDFAWGSDHVGEVWWDTTNAFFLDYTRPLYNNAGEVDTDSTLQYKRANWGKLLDAGEIRVLEWVKSPVPPNGWSAYCTKQQKLNKDVSSWVPSGDAVINDWSQMDEYDESTNTYSTYYYFWVQNPIYVPKVKSRHKTVNELARSLKDPTVLNVPWFSPIDSNSFIISSAETYITDDKSILTINYQNDQTEVIKHEQYQLCKEGADYNFNPVIWDSLFNSLQGQQILNDGTVVKLQYPANDLGIDSNKTWFVDILEARRNFVYAINSIYKTLNITSDSVLMADVFNKTTNKVNPKSFNVKVITEGNINVLTSNGTFKQNDAVLLSSTGTLPSPLNASDVYFVNLTTNGNIQLMRAQSTDTSTPIVIIILDKGIGTHSIIKQTDYIANLGIDLDMTKYWNLTDWYADGYSASTDFTVEDSIDTANQKNYQKGDCIQITGSDGQWTLYTKTYSRNQILWQAVGRQNSTLALNSKLYTGFTQYNADGSATADELNNISALALLKDSVDSLQSRLVFDMVKYAHVEQTIVDWVFKTSYIFIEGLEQQLQENYIQEDDLIDQIIEYFNEVKPYRTKIRSQIEQKTSDDDEIIGIANDLGPNGYSYSTELNEWVKNQQDIWDVEYAEYNEDTKKWEIKGSLPADFVYPNREFQESNEILVFDNVQCTPASDLYPASDLETVNSKYMIQDENIIAGREYVLQQYSITAPTISASAVISVEESVSFSLSQLYSYYDSTLPFEEAIDAALISIGDDYDATNTFLASVGQLLNQAWSANAEYIELDNYDQFNTLSNRLRLYTNASNSVIGEEVGCPFKGLTLSDNPSTRLPFGFSAEYDMNRGYILKSKSLYDEYHDIVLAANPSFTEEQINEFLVYEYGLYPWVLDISTNGKFYSDTYYVLAAMLNNYDLSNTDPYDKAKAILDNPTVDSYCMVMVPRKYVNVQNQDTGVEYIVPANTGLDDFIQEQFIKGHELWELAKNSIDDLPYDINNPLLNDVLSTVVNSRSEEYIDDMNSYDNLALESQYKTVTIKATSTVNTTKDPVFIDITDINPEERDVSQMKFTVNGYNFDSAGNAELRDFGNYQIEGFVVLNPYNKKEVLVSIPTYSDAMAYLDKSNFNRPKLKYINKVKEIKSTAGVVTIKNTNLVDGDTVAVFTSTNQDYDALKTDGTWTRILSINSVKTGNRPTLFKVTSVVGDVVTIAGLVFDNVRLANDTTYVRSGYDTNISFVKVNNFNDASFTQANHTRYSTERTYSITAIDYDIFYDRTFESGTYTTTTTVDDYDLRYISNEYGTDRDGNEVINGFYMPTYSKGALSELVRNVSQESVQMFIYEYSTSDINPVLTSGVWSYSSALVDGTYINNKSPKMTFMFSNGNDYYVGSPVTINNMLIEDGKVLNTSNYVNDDLVSVNAEIIKIRNDYLLRDQFYTVKRDYLSSTLYTVPSIVYGKETLLTSYGNGFNNITFSTYSNGYSVSTSLIGTLLTQQ